MSYAGDDFPTPYWVTQRIRPIVLDLARSSTTGNGKSVLALEPSCGTGQIMQMFPEFGWTGYETELAYYKEACGFGRVYPVDYLSDTSHPPGTFDICVMNPPYSLKREFVEKALKESKIVVAFLPIPFLESKSRYDFLKQRMPREIHLFTNRVPSVYTGKSDSRMRGWFIWDQHPRTDTVLRLIPPVPIEERQSCVK